MIQARRMDEFRDLKTRNQLGRRKKQVQVLEDKRRAKNKEHYLEDYPYPYLILILILSKQPYLILTLSKSYPTLFSAKNRDS